MASEIPTEWLERPGAIVAAHPDDEVIGVGSLLPQFQDLRVVVHVTDGAPRRGEDIAKAGVSTWQEYAQLRRWEFQTAMREAGVTAAKQVCLECPDQEASFCTTALTRQLMNIFEELRPAFVFTHPYEGGHPDHDTTALAVHCAAELLWNRSAYTPEILEFSSYHQGSEGMETGRFLPKAEWTVNNHELTEAERNAKRKLFECYQSQRNVLQYFAIEEEPLRPAPQYDFTKPPHEGKLYYENFAWGVTGEKWRALAAQAIRELELTAR